MSDCQFVAQILADGREHSHTEILTRSLRERGHGLTIHSRVAELRRRNNMNIVCRVETDENGRKQSFYRLAGALNDATTSGNSDPFPADPPSSPVVASLSVSQPCVAPKVTDGGSSLGGSDTLPCSQLSLLEVFV